MSVTIFLEKKEGNLTVEFKETLSFVKDSKILILSSSDCNVYNFFEEEGEYNFCDGISEFYFIIEDIRLYDSSFKKLYFMTESDKAVFKKELMNRPKFGLYRKEQKVIDELNSRRPAKDWPSTEWIDAYIYANFNDKIYLLKWKVEHGQDKFGFIEANIERLRNKAEKAIIEEALQERNVEQLQDNSTLEDYDNYNYNSNDIVVNLEDEKINYGYYGGY